VRKGRYARESCGRKIRLTRARVSGPCPRALKATAVLRHRRAAHFSRGLRLALHPASRRPRLRRPRRRHALINLAVSRGRACRRRHALRRPRRQPRESPPARVAADPRVQAVAVLRYRTAAGISRGLRLALHHPASRRPRLPRPRRRHAQTHCSAARSPAAQHALFGVHAKAAPPTLRSTTVALKLWR